MKNKISPIEIVDLIKLSISRMIRLTTDFTCQRFRAKTDKIILIMFLVVNGSIGFAQTNSCNASLKVANDSYNRSASSSDGTKFIMILTNSGSSSDTYSLRTNNINDTCSNPDGSNSSGNVNLATSFLDINFNPLNEISLDPGQSVKFLVKISVPAGTSVNKWCCSQVIAESQTCINSSVDSILHTLVIGSSDE